MLAPVAYWQFSSAGLVVVGAAVLTMLVAVVLSNALERLLVNSGQAMAGLLAAMSVRMSLPLTFVLAVAVWDHPQAPASSAMYIAPLYFVMLVAETRFALIRCQPGQTRSPNSAGQTPAMTAKQG
jgi:hypothetical protein